MRDVMAYGTCGTGATGGTNVYRELLASETLKMSSQCTSTPVLAIAQALRSKLIQANLSHMSHLSHLSHITYSPLSASTPMGLPMITTDDLLMRIWFGLILTYNKTPLFYKRSRFTSEIITLFRGTPVIPDSASLWAALDKATNRTIR